MFISKKRQDKWDILSGLVSTFYSVLAVTKSVMHSVLRHFTFFRVQVGGPCVELPLPYNSRLVNLVVEKPATSDVKLTYYKPPSLEKKKKVHTEANVS